jgi:hypothetical protein
LFFICLCLTALIVINGCGPSKASLDRAQQRITALKSKGIPDSLLSDAVKHLYQARDAMEREHNHPLARESADSMRILIARAEAMYEDNKVRLKPIIDSMETIAKQVRGGLNGLQKKKVDSCLAVVDSFLAIQFMLQAEKVSHDLVDMLPQLKFDEARAKEIQPRIPGTWTFIDDIKNKDDKNIKATEKKVFNFSSDGKVLYTENGKGQKSKTLKEDYEFSNVGTWGIAGDTIFINVSKFSAKRQNFEKGKMDPETKKVTWTKDSTPGYDSTITDHSQDRYIIFSEMLVDFKQSK